MSFRLYNTCDLPLGAENVIFDVVSNGNSEWELCWSLKTTHRRLIIFASPYERVIRPDVDWLVEVDITGKVGSTSFTKKNVRLSSETKNGKKSSYGGTIFKKDEKTFLKEYETPEKTVLVSIEVSNIRTKGLRKFPRIDLEKSISESSDLIITINDKTIHSYSQILSLNSTVFQRMFEKEKPPYMITLEDSIVYKDFLELLLHMYHPAEVIDVHNLRTILPLAKQFEATQVLEMCQSFIEKHLACPSVDMNSKIEHFLLTWKYDLEPLKMSCYGNLFPCRDHELLSLFQHGIYEIMDEKQKAGMLQYVVLRSRGTLVSE